MPVDIRKLRRAARLTQLELCLKSGISRMRLSLAECGYVELRPEEIEAIHRTVTDEVNARASAFLSLQTGRQRRFSNGR